MKWIALLFVVNILNCCTSSTKQHEDLNTILITGRYCSAFDTIMISGLKVKVDTPTKRQMDQVKKILDRISLPQNFLVYRGNVTNAVAFFQNNQNYIILNRNFLNDVDSKSSDYWLSMYLISHEIGHLLSSHLLYQNVSDSISKLQELQADYFAGATLSRLGCPLDKAKLIFNGTFLQATQGSNTHPPSETRMQFIEDGWNNNLISMFTESNPPPPDNIDEINPKDPSYTFTLRDLNPIKMPRDILEDYPVGHQDESIGEGVILNLEPLEQDDTPDSEYDDYKHSEKQSDTIQRMMDVYSDLYYSATIKVRKWIKTSTEIRSDVSILKINFRGYAIEQGDHPLDKYLDLFRFSYNKKKLDIFEDHFVIGQPIRFTTELESDFSFTTDGQDLKTFYFKEIKFLSE